MEQTTELNESVKIVRAIMRLRGVSVNEICRHTGMQAENVQAWLRGVKEALSEKSLQVLMSFLGISGENKEHLHVWKLQTKRGSISKENSDALKYISGKLFTNAKIAEVDIGKVEMSKKKRVFIIQSENNIRVMLVLQGGFYKPKNLAINQDILNVSWLNNDKPIKIDKTYTATAKNASLTYSEIDDIMNEEVSSVSWADLRLIARERSVTPTQLVEIILHGHQDVIVNKTNVMDDDVMFDDVIEESIAHTSVQTLQTATVDLHDELPPITLKSPTATRRSRTRNPAS